MKRLTEKQNKISANIMESEIRILPSRNRKMFEMMIKKYQVD